MVKRNSGIAACYEAATRKPSYEAGSLMAAIWMARLEHFAFSDLFAGRLAVVAITGSRVTR